MRVDERDAESPAEWVLQAVVGHTVVWATDELVAKCGLRGFDMADATTDMAERLVFDNIGAAQYAAERLQEASGVSWLVMGASAGIGTPTPPDRHEHRVIMVDDHADSRESHAERLRDHGFLVDDFASAEEALASIPGDVPPRVVILDIALAGSIDGYEAARRIRAKYDRRAVRLVAMTGRSRDEVRDATPLFDAILIKPVGAVELLAIVTRFVM